MEEKILMKEEKINDLLYEHVCSVMSTDTADNLLFDYCRFEKERYESLSKPHRARLDDLLNRHVPETTGSIPITDSNNEAGPVVNPSILAADI